jgi:drug/metabolite transporter superfamily protein YnfA
MSVVDLLNEVRQIDQSNPEYLNGVAAAWERIAAALEGHKLVAIRALNRVSDDWVSQRVKVLNYTNEVVAGMDALAAGVTEVAGALRAAVPTLREVKSALTLAVSTLLLPGIDIATVVQLVNQYHTTMAALGGVLVRAQEKFDVLATLSSGGGVIPTPPELPATPD